MFRSIFAIGFMVVALTLFAQAKNADQMLADISEYNRIKPLQNPKFEPAAEILSRRISDSKNRVIGQVHDVIIDNSGTIIALKADLKKMKLPRDSYMDFQALEIEGLANSYRTRNTREIVEARLPELLSNIQTAAGAEAQNFSVSNLRSAQLLAKDKRRLGNVQDVLFDDYGARVQSIYVSMSIGRLRGQQLAIPIQNVHLEQSGNVIHAVVEDDYADALIDYAGRQF